MTLIAEVPRTAYVGDGVEDTFATGFTFELSTELTVWRGAPTYEDCCEAPAYDNLLALNVDYVILAGDWLVDGADIQVLAHAVIADGETVTLMRTTPPDQPEGFGDHEEFQPEQHERTLDRMTRMLQELYHNPLGFLLLGGLAYDWKWYCPDLWEDDEPLDVFNIVRGLTWAADFGASALATVEAYDTVAKVVTFKDEDAATVGTLTIPANAGACVFATTNPAGFSKAHGAQLRATPPSGGLGAVRGLAWTIPGTVA